MKKHFTTFPTQASHKGLALEGMKKKKHFITFPTQASRGGLALESSRGLPPRW
jgi:hypothetical protein